MRPGSGKASPYDSLGLTAPRRTFLTSSPRGSSAQPRSSRPGTANQQHQQSHHHHHHHEGAAAAASGGGGGGAAEPIGPQNALSNLVAQSENEQLSTALDTKGVILAEHKVELHDMLEECVALLRNVYRSKHVLGENLKFADPCYTTDFVGQFNLATPPVFDPSYASTTSASSSSAGGGNQNANSSSSVATAAAAGGGGGSSQAKRPSTGDTSGGGRGSSGAAAAAAGEGAGGGAGNAELAAEAQAMREKLRTAEELVKKLYRRNTQLETENQFVKAELLKLEKLHGLARSKQSSLTVIDGHVPCDHPCYTKRMRRNCRSVPPQRTLMRSAVGGFGLTFPKRASAVEGGAGSGNAASQAAQDPPAVTQLKRRVLQLSEALVAVQHDNEVLLAERSQRNVLRDRLLHRYLVERDTGIAQLHAMMQELLAKVSNPMRLLRTKQQPSLNMNPVVAAQNILKDAASRLSDQVHQLSNDIMKKAGAALPVNSSSSTTNSPTNNAASGNQGEGGGAAGGDLVSSTGNINNNRDNTNLGGSRGGNNAANDLSYNRRRELAQRIQNMADSLPLAKRKQFLNMLVELRTLFASLANSNHALLSTFEEERDVHHTAVVKLKMQVAVLKDQLRALGVREDELAAVDSFSGSGGGGGGGHM